MLKEKDFKLIHKRVWVAAYLSGTRECFELRTVDREDESKYFTLWHKENTIGISLADILYEDLTRMDRHLADIEDRIILINSKTKINESLTALSSIVNTWLSTSPIFAPFAAQVQRLFIDREDGQALTMAPIQEMAAQYHALQNRFRQIADECFLTENQEDMVKRYLRYQEKEPKVYLPLSYERLFLELVPVGQKKPHVYMEAADVVMNKTCEGEMVWAEVLQTGELLDLVDFLMSRYLQLNVHYRTCKFCGKYFGVTGSYKGDYCDRLMDGSVKTCKEGGSLRLYEMRKMEEPAIREYKRSYKAHNARIRYKTMTREEFNAWSTEARKRRDKCIAGEISLQEFVAWLDSDKR